MILLTLQTVLTTTVRAGLQYKLKECNEVGGQDEILFRLLTMINKTTMI